MAIKLTQYKDVRQDMKAGDVIAFGGKGHFSEIIKFATRSTVSHVGIILQTRVLEDESGRFFNQIIESTGHDGVAVYRLSDRLGYDGEIWWLPLRKDIWESKFDSGKFYNFLFNEVKGRPYDIPQAIKSAVDVLDDLPFTDKMGPTHNKEDFAKFFCSELVAAGLEIAGMVGEINASEVTPVDLCRWNIYEDDYYMLKGEEKPISRYNTLTPAT